MSSERYYKYLERLHPHWIYHLINFFEKLKKMQQNETYVPFSFYQLGFTDKSYLLRPRYFIPCHDIAYASNIY